LSGPAIKGFLAREAKTEQRLTKHWFVIGSMNFLRRMLWMFTGALAR
jgi:hypothetical protein